MSTPPAPPPRLRPGLPVVRRGPACWQVGIDPAHAVLVRDVDERAIGALQSSDEDAIRATLPQELVHALRSHGLLYDPPRPTRPVSRSTRVRARRRGDSASAALTGRPDPLPRRLRSRVAVEGSGPVAALVATGLAYAGVRTVAVLGPARPVTPADVVPGGPGPSDLGRPWSEALADGVRALGAVTTLGGRPAHLAVLTQTVDADAPWCDPAYADPWVRLGIPHLVATAAGRSGEVGPVVVPGRTPCLHCREYARLDADPGWAVVAATLRDRAVAGGGAAVLAAPLATVTAGLAVARVLAHLDGAPASAATADDLVVREWGTVVDRRQSVTHPACGCAWSSPATTMGP